MYRRTEQEMRVLVLAPVGRDARLLCSTLNAAGVAAEVCPQADNLIEMMGDGAGAVIIAEEALAPNQVRTLVAWLNNQPPWSDVPFVILTSAGRPTPENLRRARLLEPLGNFTLLERPLRPETVQSAMRAALRARVRQYEMRARQEALLRANADLEQFAHSVSHDLREPIRSIAVYSELLTTRYSSTLDGQGLEFLGFVRAGAKRMDALIGDLLAYTQAASGHEDEVSLTPAKKPLEGSLANLAQAVAESGARVEFQSLPAVRIRETHLQQLFQNLIGNAIKYRREEPLCVIVAAIRLDGHWLFSVRDNGIGIRPEYKETIFGIFKRLHTNERYSGTGMGLAICQRIVEQYRGRIWVESELGQGSTFFFTIPE
jgi:signal transduction histidine kinase